jgi:hypothetical protein
VRLHEPGPEVTIGGGGALEGALHRRIQHRHLLDATIFTADDVDGSTDEEEEVRK